MKLTKVHLFVFLLLVILTRLLCSWESDKKQEIITPPQTESDKRWEAEQAKIAKEREEQAIKGAKRSKRSDIANAIRSFLEPEWPAGYIHVDSDGNFELPHKDEEGNSATFTFNITGISFEKRPNGILINGAIKLKTYEVIKNASDVIISRNPDILELLDTFQVRVRDMKNDLIKPGAQ